MVHGGCVPARGKAREKRTPDEPHDPTPQITAQN